MEKYIASVDDLKARLAKRGDLVSLNMAISDGKELALEKYDDAQLAALVAADAEEGAAAAANSAAPEPAAAAPAEGDAAAAAKASDEERSAARKRRRAAKEAKALLALTAAMRTEQRASIAEMRAKLSAWTKDAHRTLFVGRLAFAVDRRALKHEMGRFGRVRKCVVVGAAEEAAATVEGAAPGLASAGAAPAATSGDAGASATARGLAAHGKPHYGFAFVEFERESEMERAFREADGMRIGERRIVVDVERGRTVLGWKPRCLGGGLGATRRGGRGMNIAVSGRAAEARVRAGGSSRSSSHRPSSSSSYGAPRSGYGAPSSHRPSSYSDRGECSFVYCYISRESCSQFDSLPLTSLTISDRSSGDRGAGSGSYRDAPPSYRDRDAPRPRGGPGLGYRSGGSGDRYGFDAPSRSAGRSRERSSRSRDGRERDQREPSREHRSSSRSGTSERKRRRDEEPRRNERAASGRRDEGRSDSKRSRGDDYDRDRSRRH